MSSKARRKRREWMQDWAKRSVQRSLDHAEELKRRDQSHAVSLRSLREDLTRMIPNDDKDTFYPSGKIEQPYIRVACTRESFDMFSPDKMFRNPFYDRMKVFDLQAEQFALVLPDGRKVVWWGWRLR